MVPIFPIIGLTKRVRGRLLMASTSEVYGGKSPKIAHWYSTLVQRTGTAQRSEDHHINTKYCYHRTKLIKDHHTNTKYCYHRTILKIITQIQNIVTSPHC